MKGSNLMEKNGAWKGDDVGYTALHAWVKSRKIKPLTCEECGEEKPLDLANVSGEYKRDITDFVWLCRKCHMTQDGRSESLKVLHMKRRREHREGLYRCYDCALFKAPTEFYPSGNWDKRYLNCKDCFCKRKKERYKEQIKFCPKCVSMTKTINYRCGKCKQTRRIYKNSKATR